MARPKKTTIPTEPVLGAMFDDGPILGAPGSPPTVSTDSITSITTTTAVCGGNVTSEGGSPPCTAYGVCWSTSTIIDSPGTPIPAGHTVDGSGLGTYVSNLTSLTPDTFYYVRAYATSSYGNGFGSEATFTTSALPMDIGQRISADISAQDALLTSVVESDITNQSNALFSALSSDLTTQDNSFAAQISTQFANRHIV